MISYDTATILGSIIDKADATQFRGIDPYDFASSKLKLPKALLPKVSFMNKVSPVNFRPLLGIKPSENSKSNALFMHAMVNIDYKAYRHQVAYLFDWFMKNKSKEFDEFSVGFAFEMTLSRYQSGPGKTSLIITLFTLYAFIEYYQQSGDPEALKAILSFEKLLDEQWLKFETDNELWYSYLPTQKDEVYNATAKVGRFYALLYKIQKEQRYADKIQKMLTYLARVQNADGTWGYSTKASYVDNFHTAFVLESIYEMKQVSFSPQAEKMFTVGLATYEAHCFEGNRALHFHTAHQPKDIRSNILRTEIRDAANAIILFSKLGNHKKAAGILDWSIQHFYHDRKKHFYFFDNKLFKSRINFIRWQSWMALAISEFLKHSHEKN
jgi:hypothetical protein